MNDSKQEPQPRETLMFDSSGTFRPSDYPWLVAVRAHIKGADAATPDGPGEAGYVMLELFDVPVSRTGSQP